jgi:hypothetical protein
MPNIDQPAKSAKPARPTKRPASPPAGAPAGAPRAAGGVQPLAHGSSHSPPATSDKLTQGADEACGVPGDLDFRYFGFSERIDPLNVTAAGDRYYEGKLSQAGTFRAADQLVERFIHGLEIRDHELRNRLCDYAKKEPLRLSPVDRDRVIVGLSGSATLERLMVRLATAVTRWDLSRGSGSIVFTPSLHPLPEPAARLAVITAIHALQVFSDEAGGGGIRLVTNEAGKQLIEIITILEQIALQADVLRHPVDDLFGVIAVLLKHEQPSPTASEGRQMARMASAGRKILHEIAAYDHDLADGDPSDADLDRIGALAYDWQAAHDSLRFESTDGAGRDEEAEDERRTQVIRMRRRAC